LQPSLSLSYNSQVVDSASALTQASWAGMGWSIDIGYMQRNQNGTPNEPSDDTFNLTFNGVSTMVVKGTDGKYYASDQNFMRIEYIVTGDPNIGQDEVSYWVVWDKTGSKYYFGENSNDANYSNRANYMAWDGCSGGQPINLHRTTWRWALNRVTNIYGQSLIYRNANQGKTISSICDESEQNAVDQAAYPVDITYSNNRYRIFFVRQENRTDWDHDWNVGLSSQNFFERSRLKEIQVQHDANGNGFGDDALVRKYVLTYADEQGVNPIFKNLVWSEGGKTLTLMRITEYGYNGAGPLPATNFIYGDNMHLTQATNGYGGRVDFTYEAWYETTTTDSLAFIHHFGALDNPCYGGSSTGGWGGINGGSAFCTGGGDLQINNTGQKGMPASMIRPGSYYLLSATLKGVVGGDTARISMSNGGVTQDLALLSLTDGWQTTSGYLKLPTDADKYSAWQLKTYTHAQMNWFIARPVVTRYRVVSKTVTDDILPNGTTGKTITSTYRYDEPATNDDNHSANASVAETSQYVKEYSEFRGHGMVQERVSGMPATTTFFYQDDNRKGSAATTLVHTQDLGDSFNSLSDANWDWDASSTSLTRLAGDHAVKLYGDADWNAFYRSPATISTNRMAMVQFKVSDATGAAVIGLEDPADVNNRWAIKASGSTIQAQYHDGSGWQYPASMTLERNQWYVVLLIADNDEFFLRVWKRDDPSKVMRYQCAPATCSLPTDVTWRFKAWALNGDLYLDEYLEGYLLSLNDSLYATTTNIPVAPLPIGSYGDIRIAWTYLTESKSLAFNFDAQWVGTRSEYHYVTSDQGNAQYGNCTRTYESHWVNNGWQNYRWSVTRYYPNTTGSVYLVGLPGYSNTYHCPGGSCDWDASNLVSHTKYIYDANTTNSAPPTQGKLTKQRTLLRYAGADYTDPRYSDTAFAYDDYGNQTTVTVYPTEGNDDSFGQGTPQNTYTCYGSGDELDGTPCTDDGYHTYVKWTKNDKDHKTDLTYNYAISLPTGETDPNGNVTSATYDDFGRLKTIVRPGDDATNPTVRITYPAYGETFGLNDPFYTQAEQHITGGSYFKILKYYNGLGQILQTQVVGAVLKDDACSTDADLLPDTCDILGDTYYDEAGRLSKQAVPLAVAYGQFSYHQTDHNTNRSATTTTYDAAGRPYTVTAPDETFTRTTYGDGYDTISGSGYQVTWIRDPRGNYTATRTDLFGRTILVDAPGPDVSYTYDAADRLLTATRGGATVTLAYDLGGRKKSMADPDMGNWAYTYNALGSLLTQTDARGCVITMGYDNLNRLTSKAYGSSNCGSGNSSVNYYYDEGGASAEELGRRTRMTDASGSTTWDYDTRGRTTREVKTINGTSYTTQWTYNSADLPVTMTYPDGEVVTHTYHRQLLLDKLMSNRDANNAANNYYLVQDSLYDEAGRITRRDLGAANTGTNPVLVSAQHYTPWTTDGGRMDYMKTGTYADPGQNNLLNLTYDYDANGNILTIVDGVNIGQKQCFTYDTLNRLTKGTTFNDSALGCTTQLGQGNYDESYTYNGTTGNLASKVGVDYDYDTPLDSAHPHAVKWLEMPATGSTATAITIRARGSVAGNIWPTMELWVNQVKVRTWTVSATSYTDYTFTPNLTGRDQIDVVFTNDGVVGSEDRNLYVDYVKVGATTYQAETVMIMDRGGSTDAFDGHLVQAGSEMLPWSAALRFVVGTGGTSVGYDKNGSMTYKLAAGDAKVFTYDAENRMVEARKNGAVIATFTYDGDGNQVKAVENNVTTLYVGGHYEVSGNTIKKYYTAGGTRIAMRDNGTLRYLLTDHLGSTSVVADANGTKLSEMRYKPWGEVRFTSGTMPTDRTYTGQRSEMDTLGLMFYQARFYDPSLGRFAQADSIVPGGVQGLDRYAYVFNNPLNLVDPSGHNPECGPDGVWCDDDPGNDNDYPSMPGSYQPDVSLTRGGRVVYNLYKEYRNTPGWWNGYGEAAFGLIEFLGLFAYIEAGWNSGEIGELVAAMIAQNLFVGGNNPAACTTTQCVNGVFNFIGAYTDASDGVGGDGLFTKSDGTGGPNYVEGQVGRYYAEEYREKISRLGKIAINPNSIFSIDRFNAPSNWGNIKGAQDIKAAIVKAGTPYPYSMLKESMYYINGSFVAGSFNQFTHWRSVPGIDWTFAE
jgi:RHS repeat-associated protein